MKGNDGPGLNLLAAAVRRRAIGMVNAVYCAMAPILKAAPIATGDANISSPRRALIPRSIHNALTGVCVCGWTCFHHLEPGSAPSLEYA